MKQHVTKTQVMKLNKRTKERLRLWWIPKTGDWYLEQNNFSDFTDVNMIHPRCGGEYCMESNEPTYQEWAGRHGEKLKQWRYPLLSIGQMIEFLHDQIHKRVCVDLHNDTYLGEEEMLWSGTVSVYKNPLMYCEGDIRKENIELCDALWEAVKVVLEEECKN